MLDVLLCRKYHGFLLIYLDIRKLVKNTLDTCLMSLYLSNYTAHSCLFITLFFFVFRSPGGRDWTQGFLHAEQVLYHWTPSPDSISHLFLRQEIAKLCWLWIYNTLASNSWVAVVSAMCHCICLTAVLLELYFEKVTENFAVSSGL